MTKHMSLQKMSQTEQKECLINMVKYIDEICLKNNIKYSIMFGTLLGTIRHNGFIPWDDDIDLVILRDDYDKLKELFKNTPSDRYIWIDNLNDELYISPWAKIIDAKTYIEENGERQSNNYGMFIDIFPYDALPKKFKNIDYIKRIIINQLFNGLRKTHKKINAPINIIKTIRDKIVQLIGKNIIVKFSEKTYRKNNDTELSDDIVVSVCFADYKKGRLKKTEFDNLIRMKFENITLNSFKNYDQILKNKYGDYMQLPPEDQRVTHGIDAYWK